MARLNNVRIQEDPSSDADDDDLYAAPERTSRDSRNTHTSSSDKENSAAKIPKGRKDGGGGGGGGGSGGGSTSGGSTSSGSGRLAEIDPTQALHNQILEEEGDRDAYDPDQNPEERRQVKKQYRELQRKLQDSKNEYLQPASTGLYDTFAAAETLFTKVKQTSDATLDSRLLVAATDLALKKATNLVYGNSGIGIDADEFVGKCIAFMRHGLPRDEVDEDGPIDDAMDWAYLGREAAFKGNKRPATTDFLLGPLSVTKKVRVFKTRRAGLKRDNANLVRPVEVIQDENSKEQENGATMIALVKGIYDLLRDFLRENPRYEKEGVGLFRFVINPHSFGQTVENIFYLSFLVKDGFVAFGENDDGLPVLFCAAPASQEEHKRLQVTRNQVIFPMTMWEWQETKRVFDITEPMIPTREQHKELTSATGWYS